MSKYHPDITVRPIGDDKQEIKTCAVNGEILSCNGCVSLTVNLMGNENPNLSINVPFPVNSCALLSFNVLEVMIQEQPEKLISTLTSLLCNAMHSKSRAPC